MQQLKKKRILNKLAQAAASIFITFFSIIFVLFFFNPTHTLTDQEGGVLEDFFRRGDHSQSEETIHKSNSFHFLSEAHCQPTLATNSPEGREKPLFRSNVSLTFSLHPLPHLSLPATRSGPGSGHLHLSVENKTGGPRWIVPTFGEKEMCNHQLATCR